MCVSMRQHGTFKGTEDARVPGMTGGGEHLREKDSLTAPALAAVGYVEDLEHEQICLFLNYCSHLVSQIRGEEEEDVGRIVRKLSQKSSLWEIRKKLRDASEVKLIEIDELDVGSEEEIDGKSF